MDGHFLVSKGFTPAEVNELDLQVIRRLLVTKNNNTSKEREQWNNFFAAPYHLIDCPVLQAAAAEAAQAAEAQAAQAATQDWSRQSKVSLDFFSSFLLP